MEEIIAWDKHGRRDFWGEDGRCGVGVAEKEYVFVRLTTGRMRGMTWRFGKRWCGGVSICKYVLDFLGKRWPEAMQ